MVGVEQPLVPDAAQAGDDERRLGRWVDLPGDRSVALPPPHEPGKVCAHIFVELGEPRPEAHIRSECFEHQRIEHPQGARVPLRLGADGIEHDEHRLATGLSLRTRQHVAMTPAADDALDELVDEAVLRAEPGGDETAAVAGPLTDGSERERAEATFCDQLGPGVEKCVGGTLVALLLATGRSGGGHGGGQRPAAIASSTGKRWTRNASGSSDMGKWPSPFISAKVEPAMASCAARPMAGEAL